MQRLLRWAPCCSRAAQSGFGTFLGAAGGAREVVGGCSHLPQNQDEGEEVLLEYNVLNEFNVYRNTR